jgi:ribosomal protein S18 acetylase RimI-like enzyme
LLAQEKTMGLSEFVFRAATPADAYALAELAIIGGDGMYQFLLEDMAPKEMLAGLMARSIRQNDGVYSWRNCYVAEEHGTLAGMIHMLAAARLREEKLDSLPAERVQVLEPIDQAQDWQSFLVNSVAVRGPYRRRGVATRLLGQAVEQAREDGFARVTANVWQDNLAAGSLFEKSGFQLSRKVEVPQSPGLTHAGGSLLMTLVME